MNIELNKIEKILLKELINDLKIIGIHELVEKINKKYNINMRSSDIVRIMNKLDEEIKYEKMD